MVRKRSDNSCISALTSSQTSLCQEDIDSHKFAAPHGLPLARFSPTNPLATRLQSSLSILLLQDIVPDILFDTDNEFKSKPSKSQRRMFAAVPATFYGSVTRQIPAQSKNWELEVEIQIWIPEELS